jgi:hypothetical protein
MRVSVNAGHRLRFAQYRILGDTRKARLMRADGAVDRVAEANIASGYGLAVLGVIESATGDA